MLFIVETEKQQYFKEVLDRLEIDFPKLPFFEYFGWIYTACACKNYVLTWTYKSRGKRGRISQKHSKCGTFTRKYKYNHYFISPGDSLSRPRNWNWREMWCKSFPTLTFHTVKNDNESLFTAGIRNWLYLLQLTFFYIVLRIPFYISFFGTCHWQLFLGIGVRWN